MQILVLRDSSIARCILTLGRWLCGSTASTPHLAKWAHTSACAGISVSEVSEVSEVYVRIRRGKKKKRAQWLEVSNVQYRDWLLPRFTSVTSLGRPST